MSAPQREPVRRGHEVQQPAARGGGGTGNDLVREPDAVNLHVRFDERRLQTEPRRGVEAPAGNGEDRPGKRSSEPA